MFGCGDEGAATATATPTATPVVVVREDASVKSTNSKADSVKSSESSNSKVATLAPVVVAAEVTAALVAFEEDASVKSTNSKADSVQSSTSSNSKATTLAPVVAALAVPVAVTVNSTTAPDLLLPIPGAVTTTPSTPKRRADVLDWIFGCGGDESDLTNTTIPFSKYSSAFNNNKTKGVDDHYDDYRDNKDLDGHSNIIITTNSNDKSSSSSIIPSNESTVPSSSTHFTGYDEEEDDYDDDDGDLINTIFLSEYDYDGDSINTPSFSQCSSTIHKETKGVDDYNDDKDDVELQTHNDTIIITTNNNDKSSS